MSTELADTPISTKMETAGQRLVPILHSGIPKWFKVDGGLNPSPSFQEFKTPVKVATGLPMRQA